MGHTASEWGVVLVGGGVLAVMEGALLGTMAGLVLARSGLAPAHVAGILLLCGLILLLATAPGPAAPHDYDVHDVEAEAWWTTSSYG